MPSFYFSIQILFSAAFHTIKKIHKMIFNIIGFIIFTERITFKVIHCQFCTLQLPQLFRALLIAFYLLLIRFLNKRFKIVGAEQSISFRAKENDAFFFFWGVEASNLHLND